METKKALAIIVAAAMMIVICSGAVLAGDNKNFKEQRDKMVQQWGTLNDSQKSEIYLICDEQIKLRIKMIDKYAELGMIDKDAAKTMKDKITAKNDETKKAKELPGMRWKKD